MHDKEEIYEKEKKTHLDVKKIANVKADGGAVDG